jgi:hypothetical protein
MHQVKEYEIKNEFIPEKSNIKPAETSANSTSSPALPTWTPLVSPDR